MSTNTDGLTFKQRIKVLQAERDQRSGSPAPVAPARTIVVADGISRYVQVAIEKECAALAAMPPKSGRNDQLNRSAFNLRRFVDNGSVDEQTVYDALITAADACGVLAEDGLTQCDNSIRSGFKGSILKVGARPNPELPTAVTEVDATQISGAAGEPDQPAFTFTDGGSFIFDQPDTIPAIWGTGTSVLWAEGESLMIAGPMGLGKTTLGGQLIRARLGLGDGYVLGLPVADSGGTILYLAMDRPRQIARSLGRQFHGDHERQTAAARLTVWQGPPPADIAQNPVLLLKLAQAAGADTVIVDSVKDAATGLSNDEVGAGYNRARQMLIAAGIDLLELHHTVKRGANGGAPITAADIYGSAWIANGTGSIILLSGEPGDPIVGFKHIRQPADEVGPWQIHHDQTAGRMTISESFDVVAFVADCGPDGATAERLCDAQHPGHQWPNGRERNSAREKARRQLEKLVAAEKLQRVDGGRGGGSGRTPTVYFLAPINHEANTHSAKPQLEQSRTTSITQAITQQSRQSRDTSKSQVGQSRTQSRTPADQPITQPTVPVGDRGARGSADSNCVHCGKRVTVTTQRDAHGSPAHHSCQAKTPGGDQ